MVAKMGIFKTTRQGIIIFAAISPALAKLTFSSIEVTNIIKIIKTVMTTDAVKYEWEVGFLVHLPKSVVVSMPNIASCATAIARITKG